MLAGVGASWYQWIEQGRAKNVSREVLEAIARVLQLDEVEQRYLMRLSGMSKEVSEAPDLDDDLLADVVRNYMPSPALILDQAWDVRAVNSAAVRLFGEGVGAGNFLRLLFTDHSVRRRFADWENQAADALSRFRAHVAGALEHPAVSSVMDELMESSEHFARTWEMREVSDGSCVIQEMWFEDERLRFTQVTLDFTCQGGMRLLLLNPADEATVEWSRDALVTHG